MKPTKTLRKQLFQLTGPIFVETLLIMLLGAMDTFMLSHYSDDTVAAVGVVNQLLSLVFLVFGVSTVGTSVLCSQYLGASQQANVRQVIGVSLFFNTLIGVTTSAFLYFRAEALLKIMDLAPELIDEGLAYMQIVGGFAFIIGREPNYAVIENGAWHSDQPYGTIHRIASNGQAKGIACACFDFCHSKIDCLRIDTHADNKPMQNAIDSYSFRYCGIIHVADGTPRNAYDLV